MTKGRTGKVFVVVPAFNEGEVLDVVLRELSATPHELIVVDDGSTDETLELARRHSSHVLHHMVNRGQGASLQTGIEYALANGADVIATFDADGQHRIQDMNAMIESVASGECDVALGSRFLNKDTCKDIPRSRQFLLRIATIIQCTMTGTKLTDAHNGLRVLSRDAASHVHMMNDRMAHASEIIDQIFSANDLTIREFPVKINYTTYSKSKGQSWTSGFRIMFHYLVSRVFE